MSSNGALSTLKSLLPAPVKTSLQDARRAMRDRFRAARRRLRRPNIFRLTTPERVGVAYTAVSGMYQDEKLFLYAFARGFRPERALEIGVFKGGSASIITNAMQEVGRGRLVGVDPRPQMIVPWKNLHGRYTLIAKPSPEAIPEAREAAGGPFDLVLIDGLHFYDPVKKDIAAIMPHLAEGAYLLFHDAFHYGVATAIREAIEAHPGLMDCGYPCRNVNAHEPLTPYNGFRLLRWAGPGVAPRVVDVERELDPLYAIKGKPRPPLRPDILNHDIWYCRAVSPCEYCRTHKPAAADDQSKDGGHLAAQANRT